VNGSRVAAALLLALLLLPTTTAEEVTLTDGNASVTVGYDPVFHAGETWFIDLEVTGGDGYAVKAEFANGESRSKALPTDGSVSFSFPGATFHDEAFNVPLELQLVHDGSVVDNMTVLIDVSVPPPSDLLWLWGGMTVLWLGIAGYAVWLHRRQAELRRQLESHIAAAPDEGQDGD
jgi:CcmD family protein|tara:strand:+ start:161 stop:688 length:528 start_codon:yes stop_codon:yes gene_type:complete